MKRASLYSGSRRRRGMEPGQPAPAQPIPSAPADPSASVPPSLSFGSGSVRRGSPGSRSGAAEPATAAMAVPAVSAVPTGDRPHRRLKPWFERVLVPIGSAVAAIALWSAFTGSYPAGQRPITQEVIDAAVLNTLETQTLPSATARAAQIVGPSVVRVRAYGPVAERDRSEKGEKGERAEKAEKGDKHDKGKGKASGVAAEEQKGVGTGVIIKDDGLILSNLHVVAGAKRISVVFADGSESDAVLTGARPEHDLAVLQPKTIPDDIQPATMRATGDLREGDGVVAVGFPFDIGPSVSAGVISGFKREYRSTSGERVLSNLIQFDAAANPGNSGGPLVTLDGEVIGIVTAILNPNNQRSFVGIGFAVPIENAASAAGIPPH